MTDTPIQIPRRRRNYVSTLHVLNDQNTTIRTFLNPFRLTEERRAPNRAANILYTIVQHLQDIVNKTVSVQQEIQLNNINTYLAETSQRIDRTNSERLQLSQIYNNNPILNQIFGNQSDIVSGYPGIEETVVTEHNTSYSIEIEHTPIQDR